MNAHRHEMDSNHPEYPLERTCSHRSEPFQLSFARAALRMLPVRRDSAFLATNQGLVLLGETESSLEVPLEILRDQYGDAIRVGPPVVRYRQDTQLQEPYMGVRVLCRPEDFPAVKSDLTTRGALITDAESTAQFGVIRATAPLAKLLGYPQRLAQITRGSAREVIWFSHYAPVDPDPPGAA